jgi:GT2 family glycosyltransferase
MSQNFVASGSTTIRRDVFNKIGPFNEKYWIAEDYDYWLRISELYPIEYIHKVMYYYRIIPNGGSLTQRSDIQLKHAENIKEIRKASIDRMDLAKSTKKTSD